jgi:hypothetical protein
MTFENGGNNPTFESVTTARINNVERIQSAEDLPSPSSGTHPLEDATGYHFDGFVTSSNALELGDPSPLLSSHGGLGGFIYTGGTGAAIRGTDAPFFARDATFGAPNATMFDLSADATTEMLVESCSFSDAANLGRINSLGTINGYRVPSFKGCNFEQFDGGLTFSATSDKVFFEGCPFRDVDDSNVTILEADSTVTTDIFKVSSNCYIKDVQSDTQVVNIDASSTVNNYFKYINVDHDDSVTQSNILNGDIDVNAVGTVVRDSFPLAESSVLGELVLDSQATVTGSGAGATIDDGTYTLNTGERVSTSGAGVLQYDATYDTDVQIDATVTVVGANTTYDVIIEQNGSKIARSRVGGSTSGSSKPDTVRAATIVKDAANDTPDTFSVFLENTGGSTDLDASVMRLQVVQT